MARLGTAFDATQHDTTQSDYSELPNGIYRLEIEASDVVPTSTGSGTILKTTLVVIEPENYKGRKLFNNYNLENNNPVAQDIGQKQFASLCRAIGESTVEDSEDLHFKAFVAKIGLGKPQFEKVNGVVKNDQNGNPIVKYPARAEIKTYFFPDDDKEVPAPEIDAVQPTPAKPANDNRPAAQNDNKPAAAAATGGAKKNPWSK